MDDQLICSFQQSDIKPMLGKLCGDADFDVRYFADETKTGERGANPPSTQEQLVS